MRNARDGKPAYLFVKMNSLTDKDMIKKLYAASQVGVKIRMIVRGICSLNAGIEGKSENIEVISIVDRYLEHARVYLFCNDGNELCFISSADWMTRNLDRRIEVTCPVYHKDIHRELKEIMELQWTDNTKARIITKKQENLYRKCPGAKPQRAQFAIYNYLKAGV